MEYVKKRHSCLRNCVVFNKSTCIDNKLDKTHDVVNKAFQDFRFALSVCETFYGHNIVPLRFRYVLRGSIFPHSFQIILFPHSHSFEIILILRTSSFVRNHFDFEIIPRFLICHERPESRTIHHPINRARASAGSHHRSPLTAHRMHGTHVLCRRTPGEQGILASLVCRCRQFASRPACE